MPRTARYHVRGAPDAPEAWLLLHGYGQSAAEFLLSCAALEAVHRRLVAPEALSRFYLRGGRGPVGASWMTREDRDEEIADQRAYLDALCERELRAEQPVRVLGFSQGAAAACRWAANGARTVERLVVWGSTLPADVAVVGLAQRGTRVWLVRGKRDEAVASADLDADLARLTAAGVGARRLESEGAHEIDARLLRCAPFVE